MPDKPKKYKIVISKDALWDIKSTKKYILDTFKYREYAVLIIEISKGGNILAAENQQARAKYTSWNARAMMTVLWRSE